MGLFRRAAPTPQDRITPQQLADFGRYELLGEQSEIPDGFALISDLNELLYTGSPTDRQRLVAELERHAGRGPWESVGAWKYVRSFLDDDPTTSGLIDGGLRAVDQMRVTNLRIHLSPLDTRRFVELIGEEPPDDGFFGPPVFDSAYGPTRQYYLDNALTTAASRRVVRLAAAPGVAPGPVDAAVHALWDFGLLLHRGPLVVNPDIRFESHVLRPAVAAAAGVDHVLLTTALSAAARDKSSSTYGLWTLLGATRFVEDYLQPEATGAPGFDDLLDEGVRAVAGAVEVLVPRALLTLRQRTCLDGLQAAGA